MGLKLIIFHCAGLALYAFYLVYTVRSLVLAEDATVLLHFHNICAYQQAIFFFLSTVADISQYFSLSRLSLLIVRDHWFYVTISFTLIQPFYDIFLENADFDQGIERHLWITTNVIFLLDMVITPHKSRQGYSLFTPLSGILSLLCFALYLSFVLVFQHFSSASIGFECGNFFECTKLWIILLAINVGTFSLGVGLTLLAVFCTTEAKVQLVLFQRKASLHAGIRYGVSCLATLDIWTPTHKVKEKTSLINANNNELLPVIIFVHGGMYRFGYRWECHNVGYNWCSQGFLVVIPNYRIVPFVKWPVPVQDVAKAVGWTFKNIQHFGGDPNRVFLCGQSAGAHAVTLLGVHPTYLQQVGVQKEQIRAIVSISCGRGGHKASKSIPLIGLDKMGKSGEISSNDRLISQHLENMEDKTKVPPLMLIYSSHESRLVGIANTELFQIFESHGCRVELAAINGEGHISAIVWVGMPDDVLTPVVLNYIKSRLEGDQAYPNDSSAVFMGIE